jgi:N utilization substance protein B
MKRHQALLLSIIALYQNDINNDQIGFEQAIELVEDYYELKVESDILSFCQELYEGTIKHLDQIDEVIKQSLFKWTIDRLSYVDRAIIRLATFELLFANTPAPIVINEAVEITKYFCVDVEEAQVKFNNRLLDTIKENAGIGK